MQDNRANPVCCGGLIYETNSVFCVFCCVGIFGTADRFAEDYLYHHPSGTSEKIKIIKIDDKTINAMGDFDSWDRDDYADLVEALTVSDNVKPEVIGFDILFSSDFGNEADRRFADACEAHGNVVCAFSYVFDRELTTDEQGSLQVNNLHAADVVKPYSSLYAVTKHGFANALMDSGDGLIRNSFLFYPVAENERELSFSAQVNTSFCESSGTALRYPYDGEKPIFSFRYSGRPGDYENVSLCDVLDGSVPAEAFDDCIVLVGAYTAGMMDAYYVPVDHGQQMYGVEIHANVIQALLDERFLYVSPEWIPALASAVLAGILAYLCSGAGIGGIVLWGAGFILTKLLAGYILFSFSGYSGDVLTFLAAALVIILFFVGEHYYSANRAKRQIEHAFKKYVAPQVVNEIAKNGNYELKLGGENRDIAVLFVDIRGFTPLSESLEPEQVVDILNSYLALTTSCIFKHGGTLDKFVGDATIQIACGAEHLCSEEYRCVGSGVPHQLQSVP